MFNFFFFWLMYDKNVTTSVAGLLDVITRWCRFVGADTALALQKQFCYGTLIG